MRFPFDPKVLLALCLILLPAPTVPRADSFTTAEVVEATAAVDCLDWKIVGICLKLKCGFFGCRIKAYPWVEHRIPDLVVSSYNEPGETPWLEARTLYGQPLAAAADAVARTTAGVPLGGGHSDVTRPGGTHEPGSAQSGRNLRFKEVMIVGNPATVAFRQWLTGGAVPVACSTSVTPMALYFSSEVDSASWRTGIAEQLYPATWAPWARPIGRFPQGMWGKVYPRQGHVQQYHDVLAGAVAAQRAVDVATRAGQPHLYLRVPGISESDEKSDRWQMIHPRSEKQCNTFGEDREYFRDRENVSGPGEGGYGWVYWPLHDCCPGSGKTIARIRF